MGGSGRPPCPPTLVAPRQSRDAPRWRSKHGSELDFVLAQRGGSPVAIECTWSADELDPAGFRAFRNRYPQGHNILVATDIDTPVTLRLGGLAVRLVGLTDLPGEIARALAEPGRG